MQGQKLDWKYIAKCTGKVLAFLLCLTCLMQVFSMLFMPKKGKDGSANNKDIPVGFLAEPENTLDIFMVGNSNLYSGVIPTQLYEEYGITCYVSGVPAASMRSIYQKTRQALKQHNPKVVVLEVDALYYGEGRSLPVKDGKPVTQEAEQKPPVWKQKLMKVKSVALRAFHAAKKFLVNFSDQEYSNALGTYIGHIFPLIKYHERWDELNKEDVTRLDQARHFETKGHIISVESIPFIGDKDYMRADDAVEAIPKKNEMVLRKMLALCKKENIQLVLLNVSAPHSWSTARNNAVSAFAQENGIAFLDYNTLQNNVGIDWQRDTRDGGFHLNTLGAQKVTAHLGEYLNQHFDWPDHRNDPAYQQWDEDAAIFDAQLAEKLEEKKKAAA